MRRSPHIIVSKFLISFFISGTAVLGTSISLADNLVNMQEPLRMDDLDDYGLFSNPGSEIPYPLIYPAEISIFNLLDSANPSFQSLEDLGKLPVRNKFEQIKNRRTDYTRKPSKAKPSKPTIFGATKDPVVKFIKSSPEHSLPTDDELQAFLKNGVKNNSKATKANELKAGNSSSDKTFAEFRNEAESSIISQIFKRSSSRKMMQQKDLEISQKVSSRPKTSSQSLPPTANSEELFPVLSSTLKLKAHKPNHDGKLEPAQASEFYLTTQNLNDLLQNMDAGPAVAGELKSVAELWAKAEKNVSQAPEVALGVKSILLQAKVSKARTDPYGEASLRGVQPDEKYYLIGIDKDVLSNVVTIWSKEVEVQPGENIVELSSSDVIYQE